MSREIYLFHVLQMNSEKWAERRYTGWSEIMVRVKWRWYFTQIENVEWNSTIFEKVILKDNRTRWILEVDSLEVLRTFHPAFSWFMYARNHLHFAFKITKQRTRLSARLFAALRVNLRVSIPYARPEICGGLRIGERYRNSDSYGCLRSRVHSFSHMAAAVATNMSFLIVFVDGCRRTFRVDNVKSRRPPSLW